MIRLALAAIAACLALPAVAQGPAASPPAARQYLWEVASLTNRLYLYGTVHAGKPSFFPLPAAVEKAFTESKVLAVEADITDVESMTRSAAKMVYEPPATLDKEVSKALWDRTAKQAARLSIPVEQLAQLRPFMAGTLLAFAEWGRLGYLPQFGVDLHLLKRASQVRTMASALDATVAEPRMRATLLALFAGLALALAAIGVYGVVAYLVGQRTQEIGVRRALGARAADVMSMLMREAMRPVVIGMVLGVVSALAMTRALSAMLYGVSTTDVWTYAIACAVLGAAALAASIIPARRALGVDPISAVRGNP